MAKKKDGASDFETYYQTIFGTRWYQLKESLLSNKTPVSITEHLKEPYQLDMASVIVAQSLGVKPGMSVLDLCAAPGGKALVLATMMKGEGLLTVNDRSTERFFRLKRNMERLTHPYIDMVTFTKYDAMHYSFYKATQFDAVLLDAPCSSEEHLLKNDMELKQWSAGRTKRLATNQFAMLCQALLLCKSGGTIVYSTCSLSPFENDRVIEKLFKKRHGQFTIDSTPMFGEKTTYGYHILPDQYAMGPLFYSKIIKANK